MRVRTGMVLGAIALLLGGCSGRADLGERRVLAMTSATELAKSRNAYGRADERSEDVATGMSVAEVETAMGAFVAVETREGVSGEPIERRATILEGRLCVRDLSEQRQRWVFGYDEGRVVFVGFVVEFGRDDARDDWKVRTVDRKPSDTCEPGEGHTRSGIGARPGA